MKSRQKRPEKIHRDQHLSVRLTVDEKQHLKEMAQRSDARNASEFVRSAAMGYPVKSVVTHEAINELRRLGGLVKHLFLEEGRQDPDGMYLATLQELKAAIHRLGRDS